MEDPQIIRVNKKPKSCPNCNNKVVRIMYGFPTHEVFEKADRKEVILGGCCLMEENPQWGCISCETQFLIIKTKPIS